MGILLRLGLVGVCIAVSGCSEDEPVPPKAGQDAPYLGLTVPEPGKGFQVRSLGTTIRASEDVEYCEVAEFPGDPSQLYYVNAIELANAAGSHHLVMDAATVGGPAEVELAKAALGQPVTCIGSRFAFGEGFEPIGAIPRPYGKLEFPPGVGRVYRGGQRFVFNYHYLNTGTEDLQARSAANFYLVAESEVEHVAQAFNFDNWTIETPPHQSASFRGECTFDEEVTVSSLLRHTHRWGTDYSVWFAGGSRAGEHIWTSTDWEHDVDFRFAEPVLMQPGEGFQFECAYDNPEDRPLKYGPKATDEMCILVGIWWGSPSAEPRSQDCTITRVGDDGVARPGTAVGFPKPSRSEVAECLQDAADRVYPGESEICDQCACNGCGGALVTCNNDPDCDAIFDCILKTQCDETTCGQTCGDIINQHTAGLAALAPAIDCLVNACPDCVPEPP